MGNTASLDNENIEKYKSSVLFTSREIGMLYNRFVALGGSMDENIPLVTLITIPELINNPFRYRIARVFAETHIVNDNPSEISTGDSYVEILQKSQILDNYTISFHNFLRLMSTFSWRADFNMKSRLAFAIYDFDHDGMISTTDVQCMLTVALGTKSLHPQQCREIAHEVIDEVDIDGNRLLSELEFSRVLSRLPDFNDRMTFEIDGV